MFDLSLLIGLPKPNSIDTSSLTPEDAAIKLRQAATLRLNGAQSILLHFPQDVELAVELLDDAAVLYDKAFRNLTGIPAQSLHQQIHEYVSVPSAEGSPAIQTPWGDEFAPIIKEGVRCAEAWLEGSSLHRYGGRCLRTENAIVQVIPKRHLKQVFCCGCSRR